MTLRVATAFLLVLSLAKGATESPHPVPAELPERSTVLVRVDGQAFTAEELRQSMRVFWSGLFVEAPTADDIRRAEDEILESFVDRVLAVNAGRRMDPPLVSTADIESEFARRLEMEFDGKPERMRAWWAEMGRSEAQWRAEIEADLTASRVREMQVQELPPVTSAQVEKFYAEHTERFDLPAAIHLRIILLTPRDGASGAVIVERTKRIMDELAKGADFGELAREFSTDSRRNSGGDWGWIVRKDLVDELAVVAFALRVGEWSEPVPLGNDVFVLQVVARREAGIAPFDAVSDQIVGTLESQAKRAAVQTWLQDLRRNTNIEWFTPATGTILFYTDLH